MNKYLITVVFPNLEDEYELYVPNNKKIGTIKKYVLETIGELLKTNLKKENEVRFIDRETGVEYQNDVYVKDSGIKNGSIIIAL